MLHGLLVATSLAAPPKTTWLVVLGEPSALKIGWRPEQPRLATDPDHPIACIVTVTSQDQGEAVFNTSACPAEDRVLVERTLGTATARPLEELGWGVFSWSELRFGLEPEGEGVRITLLPRGIRGDLELHADEVVVRERVEPVYPPDPKWRRVQGDCAVAVAVDTKGRPTTVVPVDCDRGFEEATVEAVERWRFRPHRVDGVLTPFRVVVRVDYVLQPASPDPAH